MAVAIPLPTDPAERAAMLEDATATATGALLGTSKAMERVRDTIARAAPGDTTILVRGETGTGKELVARAVHEQSGRAHGPMVVLHCAALPDTLLESELFGHEKGAFTGADRSREGRVEAARGGTLFLDEIGDVTPAMQVKLLRLLQEKQFERLGGNRTLQADVRFVAATHRNLEDMVKRGTFREDLFYRLNVVPLWVPPLRARRGDVAILAQAFCERFATEGGKGATVLSPEALAAIVKQRWPGNVRQLENLIERLVVLCEDGPIGPEDVARLQGGGSPFATEPPDPTLSRAERLTAESDHFGQTAIASFGVPSSPDGSPGSVRPLQEQVGAAEKRALEHALERAGGNRSKAARLLGISRQTLYKKLHEHGLATS